MATRPGAIAGMWEAKLEPAVISCSAGSRREKDGHWQQALSLPSKMRQAASGPNVISYSSGIRVCVKDCQWQQTLS
eukprot:8015741-Pyramimonas_sp.AAC.1